MAVAASAWSGLYFDPTWGDLMMVERNKGMLTNASYLYVVRMDVALDHEEEFNRNYDTEHIPTVLKAPGMISAARFETSDTSAPITLRRPPDVPPQQQPAEYRHHTYRGEAGKQGAGGQALGCELDANQHAQCCPHEPTQQRSGDTTLMVEAGVEGDRSQDLEGPVAGGRNDRDQPGLHNHYFLPGRKDYAEAGDHAPNYQADQAPEDPDEQGGTD